MHKMWEVKNANSEIVAIHAALVPSTPTGEIVYFAGFFGGEKGRSRRYDCKTAQTFEIDANPFDEDDDNVPDINLFCSGHAFLADGRWFVAGGSAPGGVIGVHDHGHGGTGSRDCFIYHPRAREWKRAAFMHYQPGMGERGGGRWYPTLVTLADGKVLAVGGHPRAGDAMVADTRHNNNTPELYSPTANEWKLLQGGTTAPSSVLDEYDRLHLAPTGHVLFTTLAKAKDDTRLFDPYAGIFANQSYGTHLDTDYDDANCSAKTTSLLLPILHEDLSNVWVFVCGAEQAERLNLKAANPTWMAAGSRDWPNQTPPVREHLFGLLLPTGQVFVGGGMRPGEPRSGVMYPEIYSPAINWTTGKYTGGSGNWKTLDEDDELERAEVPRGYHSVALLQPDGTVWTAGSTDAGGNLTDPTQAVQELRIEVFSPHYGSSRPVIQKAWPSVSYGENFTVNMQGSGAVHRVAITRCGSFTHALDGDQRYLTLPFTKSGSKLTVSAPSSPTLAPPGTYMLWVLRNETTPCQQAHFIRLCYQDAYFATEVSTYSLTAVKALKKPYTDEDEATFVEALQLFYEGFLPHELDLPGSDPSISWAFDNGDPVPGMRIELNRSAWEVNPVAYPDLSQKFTYVYDVVFEHENAFATFADDKTRKVIVHADLGQRRVTVDLTLMKKANPFMKNGDPPWLSPDVRILKASAAEVEAAGSPHLYLQDLLDSYNSMQVVDEEKAHPFASLSTSQEENPVVLEVPKPGSGVYNFAIARVRYMAIPGENAAGVKVFFRLFNTVGTALEYDKGQKGTYKLLNSGATTIPGLGTPTGYIVSIPFFGEQRVTPSKSMAAQTDNAVNRRTVFGKGAELEYVYFGCWLDMNTREKHFPRFPTDDGPYPEQFFPILSSPIEMVQHIAGYHQCLVAEIYYQDDPTDFRDTPFTNDNLAQRNLAMVPVANPGVEITRTAQTTFEVKQSEIPPLAPDAPPLVMSVTSLAARRRLRPDELLFWRNNLPPGTVVTLYLPDVDVDEIIELAGTRHAPPVLQRVDEHTLRFEPGEVTFVPLPGRDKTIPGLLSVALPAGIQKGQVYRLSVQQLAARTLRFIGAFELTIPVGDKATLLPDEVRKLSLLRYVAEAMPPEDRWYPIFARYLGEIAGRVRGFGGDPESVHPSPHGSGERDVEPEPEPRPTPQRRVRFEGKIDRLLYDCFGDFEGFVLQLCDGERRFVCKEKAIERVIDSACCSRRCVTVITLASEPHKPYSIEVGC